MYASNNETDIEANIETVWSIILKYVYTYTI